MSQAAIRGILQSRLAAWAGARTPPLPVVWENVRVPSEPTTDHLRTYLMPATTRSPFMDGDGRVFVGVFQVSIFTVPGAGPLPAERIVAELDALYPCYARLSDASGLAVQVMSPVSASPAQQEPGWHQVSASFRYQSYRNTNA